VAIVYDSWFRDERGRARKGFGGPGLPREWSRIGTWRIADKLYLDDDTVSFYAANEAEAACLRRNLQEFNAFLPASVASSVAGGVPGT
jgi:hypothetical protein